MCYKDKFYRIFLSLGSFYIPISTYLQSYIRIDGIWSTVLQETRGMYIETTRQILSPATNRYELQNVSAIIIAVEVLYLIYIFIFYIYI